MTKAAIRRFGVLALASATLVACDEGDDVVGPDDDAAEVQVRMASDGSAAGSGMPLSAQVVEGPSHAPLHLDVVESIILPIGTVEARQEGAGWVEIGAVDADVDLLALPEEGIVLVGGEVPDGDYDRLRFFLTAEPTIVLSQTVTVGRTTYEAGPNPLRIPSVDQAGFRVAADFDVGEDDGEVLTIVVDEDATLGHVTATGDGTLMIAPVLTVRNDEGLDVGEFDDDDEDDEEDAEFEGFVSTVGSSSVTLEDGTVVLVDADTEFDGDLLSLAAVQEELDAGAMVEAEGEGELQADGSILADEIEFEVDDDDDGDTDDESDEAEGDVLSIDEGAGTLVVFDLATQTEVTVQWTEDTVVEIEGDAETLAEVVAALATGAEVEAEAEGTFDGSGVLVAETLTIEVDAS